MEILYNINNLNIHFLNNNFNLFSKNNTNKAVNDVNLNIYKGETLGLVGESGSGKSTLGKALIKLIKPTSGSILYKGQEITELEKDDLRKIRKNFGDRKDEILGDFWDSVKGGAESAYDFYNI